MLQKIPTLIAAALVLASSALGCAATPQGSAGSAVNASAPSDMVELIEAYDTDSDALRSFYNLRGSETRLGRLDDFDQGWLAKLDAIDYEALSVDEAVDWQLLRIRVEYEIAKRERERALRAGAAELLAFSADVQRLEEERWTLTAFEPRVAAERVAAIADAVEEVSKRVRKPRKEDDDMDEQEADEDGAPIELTPAEALRASRWVSSQRRTLDTWYRHYAQFEPEFDWWVAKPQERAKKAIDALAKKLREDLAAQKGKDDDPLVGSPIGREALMVDLAGEFLAYTPEELIEIGEEEFAWCEGQLLMAAAEMGELDSWSASLEKVKKAYVPPGEQDDLVAAQAREMIAWLDERELVTIPELCRETWRVRMLDKNAQRTLPFAAYSGQKVVVAYPTNDMTHAEKLMSARGNNKHFTRCVTPHELIPGHHLQGFMAQRYATHRRSFRTPFLVEGWALYWEMLEWDEGWPQGPEDRIGMLFWRMHRAARIIVSLKYHLGLMTPEEMIELLVHNVGHEEENARAEVRRYIGDGYSPLYQCGYMIGGLQLRTLAKELITDGGMSPKQFHDAVLAENSIPIELMRAALKDEKPAKDAQPSWRFYVPD